MINSISNWRRLAGLVILVLLSIEFSVAQEVHPSFLPGYFYDNTDTVIANGKSIITPDKKTLSFLKAQGLVFLDTCSFEAEVQNGFDTILNVTGRRKSHSFFLYPQEISNGEYAIFEKEMNHHVYYPDTLVWKTEEDENHPFIYYYYQHPAYRNYPVVGVSHWQALQYCKWKEKKINQALQKKGITDIYLEIDLPTENEWQAAYRQIIQRWLNDNRKKKKVHGNSYIDYVLGINEYRCNFGKITSNRGARLKTVLEGSSITGGGYIMTPTQSFMPVYSVYNLLGNVAEWTSTSAAGNLFNYEQYIYTTTHRIIPNYTPSPDKNRLKAVLHDSAVMTKYFAIKGGSWNQEIYYLEPRAIQFKAEWQSANNVGFRYVARVYRKD